MQIPENLKIGMRIWKTVIAVAITAVIMQYWFKETAFFGCIGAVVAVGRSGKESLKNSMIRNTGTLIGGLVGIAMLFVTDNPIVFAFGVIPVIIIHNIIDMDEPIVPACIVYFAVVYLMANVGNAELYALRRIFYTFIGTAIGLGVNMLFNPPPVSHNHEKSQIKK